MPPARSAHAAEATANRWSREILGGKRALLTFLFRS
jgi:hypothetical protein